MHYPTLQTLLECTQTKNNRMLKMRLKSLILRIVPSFMLNIYRGIFRKIGKVDRKQLETIQRIECKGDNLRYKSDLSLSEIFSTREIESMWLDSEKEINQFNIPDGAGGVNPGDRRAVYYLINAIKPSSVLEIGTHIGASTVYIASALQKNKLAIGIDANLTTVDIIDVNCPIKKPWLKHGATYSPSEMVDKMGFGSSIEFVVNNSLSYAAKCERRYDFIFLDGDHSAAAVYQEIPIALDLLNKNGVILLHDYFPGLKPLWANSSFIPGPFLATERFREEGLNVTVVPLGKLPWPTKLQSNVTSLALLLRSG